MKLWVSSWGTGAPPPTPFLGPSGGQSFQFAMGFPKVLLSRLPGLAASTCVLLHVAFPAFEVATPP